jgi:hypothetical protein
MDTSLTSRPRKLKRISTPGLKGMDYQRQLDLCRDLERENPLFVDYVLKPATDEMWNLIDGSRTVGEIIDYALLEFDLSTEPATWLIVFVGWSSAGLIGIGSD